MRGVRCVVMLVAILGTTANDVTGLNTFDRYRVILDRKPFGAPPPVQAAPTPMKESFAAQLRLCKLISVGDTVLAGFEEKKTKKQFELFVDEVTDDGVKLVAADVEAESAYLEKGSESYELRLSGEVEGISRVEIRSRMSSRTSKREMRRRIIQREKKEPEPPEPPMYEGEELKQHLREYNLELIRARGALGPPLPIELTPEEDAILQQEGVLPAPAADTDGLEAIEQPAQAFE